MEAVALSCSYLHPRNFFKNSPSRSPPPFLISASKSKASIPTLRISNHRRALRNVNLVCWNTTSSAENYGSDDANSLPKEVTFDIKLPRRNLMVQFTCDACGERTKRVINRVAYERGTVFLQCAGCLVYHKFVDNLGLVVEYDLREEDGEVSDEPGVSNIER
ncbi:uncharacterized protein [Typha latifolia]|uniref:uncharacterized protein n=1 Tax=Typha latifolia TaxID=4733 RepID=UPI003C2E6A03